MVRAERGKPTTKLKILAAILGRSASGERFPSLSVLAEEVGSSRQTVGSIVNRMIASGEIPASLVETRRPQGSEEKPASAHRISADQWNEVAEWEWAVSTVVRRYRRRWRDAEEMKQVARLGLARAVKNYRGGPKRDYYFAHMHGFMKNYVRDEQAVKAHRGAARPKVVSIGGWVDGLACGQERFCAISEEEHRDDAAVMVGRAIGNLDARLRQVVGMRMRGATLAEVGTASGVSNVTAMRWEREAHGRLREMLADYA